MSNAPVSSPSITTHTFRVAEGNRPMQLSLYRPPPSPAGSSSSISIQKHPAVVFYHGGGLVLGNRYTRLPIDALIAPLVDRGWIFISADYHLLPESTGWDIREDVEALGEWLVREAESLKIDLEKIAISGASAGSFVAMLAPTVWANVGVKPKAFLSLYGMVDITNPWYTAAKPPGTQIVHAELDKLDDTKFESFFNSERQAVWDDESNPFELDTRGGLLFWMLKHGKLLEMLDGTWKPKELHHIASGSPSLRPFELIDSSFPPTICLHGDIDGLIKINDSLEMIKVLKNAGVSCDMVICKGTGHGLHPNEKYRAEFEEGIKWLERYVVS